LKRNLLVGLGWLISLVFLYFALRDLNWSSVLVAFAKVSPLAPIAMIGTYCLGFVLRSWRWRLLLPRGIVLRDSLAAVVLGYAANNILPARLGEIVRAQAIGQKAKISRSLALASIFVERVFDGLVLTGLLYLGIRGSEIPTWASSVGVLGLSLFGGALTCVLLLALTRSLWSNKIELLPSLKLRQILQQFARGLTLVGRDRFLPLTIFGLSLTVWLVEGIMFYIAIKAFALDVPPTAALFVMGVINLGILVPSAPGYLGAFQYFGLLAFGAWKVPAESALACIVMVHACQYLPITLWGLSYIPYFGFSSLGKLSSEVK
jgi:glycosyltransferase 2 family protein